MKIKIQAVNDKILMKVLKADETAGGLMLPAGVTHGMPRYLVTSVGEGHVAASGERIKPCVEEGDMVIVAIPQKSFELEGEDYVLIEEKNIGAVVKKKDIDK